MRAAHLIVLIAWTITMLLIVGLFVVAFTLGDCMDEVACAASKKQAVSITFVTGLVIYEAVFFRLVRRWSR